MGGKTQRRNKSKGPFAINLSGAQRASIAQAGALVGILDINRTILVATEMLKNYAMQKMEQQRLAAQQAAAAATDNEQTSEATGAEAGHEDEAIPDL